MHGCLAGSMPRGYPVGPRARAMMAAQQVGRAAGSEEPAGGPEGAGPGSSNLYFSV